MNYLKTILIATVLLSINTIHSNEQSSLAEMLQNIPNPFDTTATTIQNAETTDSNSLDAWNNHLQSLKDQDEFWDTANNSPTDPWVTKAHSLAEEVLKKDTNLAETLKLDFANALNAKTTKFADIMKIIEAFDNFIKQFLAASTPKAEEIIPTPAPVITPELVMSEPTIQPQPEPETSTSTQETTSSFTDTASNTISSSSAQGSGTDSLDKEWKDLLEKVTKKEMDSIDVDGILQQIYNTAQQLRKDRDTTKLRADFLNALQTRKYRGGQYQPNLNQALRDFDIAVGRTTAATEYESLSSQNNVQLDPQLQLPQATSDQFSDELQNLREQLAQQDENARAEAEKQKEREKELLRKEIELKAATLQAQEASKAHENRFRSVDQALANLKSTLEKEKSEREAAQLQEQKLLKENITKLANAQKAEAEKGLVASVMDWWSGSSKNQIEIKEQRKIIHDSFEKLAKQYSGSGPSLHQFETLLFNFEKPHYWDETNNRPNQKWVSEVQLILIPLIKTYTALTPDGAYELIKAVLRSKMTYNAIEMFVDNAIKKPTDTELLKFITAEKQQEEAILRVAQQKKEKKERIALAQQKIKDEEDRVAEEQKRQLASAARYKNEKKEWYTLLQNMAQQANATNQDNNIHTENAIKKSQSLLQLAGDIPKKNKTAVSQKLKQKFTVALLEQQKNGEQSTNVHRNMDIFNNEVNKMVD